MEEGGGRSAAFQSPRFVGFRPSRRGKAQDSRKEHESPLSVAWRRAAHSRMAREPRHTAKKAKLNAKEHPIHDVNSRRHHRDFVGTRAMTVASPLSRRLFIGGAAGAA